MELALAELEVLKGEEHIAEQRRRVEELESAGLDAALAKEFLATLEQSQALHIQRCNQLIEELALLESVVRHG